MRSSSNIVRLFLVLRVLRLIPVISGVHELLLTLSRCWRVMLHMMLLLFSVFLFYAVIGVQLWADVRYGEYITEAMNFTTIGNALLVLFTMSTGENWNGFMHDCQSFVRLTYLDFLI